MVLTNARFGRALPLYHGVSVSYIFKFSVWRRVALRPKSYFGMPDLRREVRLTLPRTRFETTWASTIHFTGRWSDDEEKMFAEEIQFQIQ